MPVTKSNQHNTSPARWGELRETLGDSFTVRVRGILKQELRLLDRNSAEAGRLGIRSLDGADLRAGNLEARIERSGSGYRMLSSGVVLGTAGPLAESVSLSCGGETHEVRASPLCNAASARSGNGEIARIEGDLPGRRYGVSLEAGNERALPVALFLLYLTVALRSRAYRATAGRAWYRRET